MEANVAVYTFAISVFVAFLLWSSKNLGIIGLLGAFSVGLISYSMDSSIEIAVASIVIAGVIIKFVLPSIQSKWIEKYSDYSAPAIEQKIHSAERTHERIQAMQKGNKTIEGFRGLAPQLLEGFADATTASLAAPATGQGLASAGGVAATMQMPNAPAMQQPNVSRGPTNVPGGGVATVSGTPQVGQPGAGVNATYKPEQGSMQQQVLGAAVQQPAPTAMMPPTASMAMMSTMPTTASMAMMPSMATTASMATPAMMPSMATMATPAMMPSTASMATPTFNMTAPPASAPVQPGGATNVGALSSPGTPDLSNTATSTVNTQGAAANTIAAPVGTGTMTTTGFRNIETFAEQPQAVPGMFKLGELPSETKTGPHIDAGTTIMRALGALNPDQISSLTDDTRKLLDTQKSLMGMLSTMKPMLSDGQNLLSSFTNMFGKTN